MLWEATKNTGCASFFQPTCQCLDIWWNTLPCVWYVTKTFSANIMVVRPVTRSTYVDEQIVQSLRNICWTLCHVMTKQASQRDQRKKKHFNENRNKHCCFQYVAATFFNNQKRASCLLTKFNTKSVCSFSPLQTLSLIYHLFSFPTTHFPLIALKPTDEKESFCLLALVFDDRLYKRLFLILCKDITLIMRGFFVSRNQTQSQTDRVHPCPIN